MPFAAIDCRRRLLPVLLAAALLSACAGTTPAAAPNNQEPIPTAVQLTLEEAEAVAATFLEAWRSRDYAGMYRLVSFRSRDAYSEDYFVTAYDNARAAMSLTGLDFQIRSSIRQGNTAALNYEVTFHTGLLGDIIDSDRTIRLVVTEEGWRVAWATTDIFAEMAGGSVLVMERTVPTRANIYDRDGRILVNQSGVAIPVNVVQENIPNYDACFSNLMRVLRLSASELQAIYNSRAPNWITTVGEIDAATYSTESDDLIRLCDAEFDERPTRRYVSGGLAPHVIGYVGFPQPEMMAELAIRGVPEDAIVGITGIERAMDEVLTGQPGGRLQIISPAGDVLRTLGEVPAGRSESVHLTLDSRLQLIVQQALSDAYNVANWGPVARGAAAVVMDVNTGEILAAASYPSYDPNLFNPDGARPDAGERLVDMQNNPRNPQLNRVTQAALAPGSIFKIVTMIAAADSGVYSLDHQYVCSGSWDGRPLGDIVRTDWYAPGHGALDLRGGLINSCDPYFYQTGYDLNQRDANLLPNYAIRLGFGQATGLDVLPEAAGLIPNPEWKRQNSSQVWGVSDAVNMAIGQGDVLITPLQMVRLVAAVANGGDLMKPQLVHHVGLIGEEPSQTFQPVVERNLGVRQEVITAVQEALCEIPISGTADYVFGARSSLGQTTVSLCGKTGTAQTGGETTPPHAWFAAYAPPEEPEIAIVVVVENSHEGSWVAAPIVRRILETYYGTYDVAYPPNWWPPRWWQGDYEPLVGPGA